MSMTLILPVPKAIAFGGVATGNMNANEQVTPTGNIRYMGFLPKCTAWNKSNVIYHHSSFRNCGLYPML